MMAALTLAAMLLAADLTDVVDPEDAGCRVVHHAADGTMRQTPPSRLYTRPSGVAARAHSSGDGGTRSSAVVSARSSSSGAAASTVRTESGGRRITKSYDNDGCTVVIDDRPARGE